MRLWLLLFALLAPVIAAPVQAAPAQAERQVPRSLPGLGAPVADHEVRARLQHYCAPIQRWHQLAFDLCLESGFNVNRAVRDYHQRGCATSSDADCRKLQQLYAQNFRLWDGSVDNVGRAKGMGGGKRTASTAQPAKGAASKAKNAAQESCQAATAAAGQALARLELWQQQWQPGAAADALEDAPAARLQEQLQQLEQAREQLLRLWPTMPTHCTKNLSQQAEQFQQQRRLLDESLAQYKMAGQLRLQALQQQAACNAALLLQAARLERFGQQLQQERWQWRQRWLGAHPAPLRLNVPNLPQLPILPTQCDSNAQQLAVQWQQLQQLQQQMRNERHLTLMLLAGDAHYPLLQQSRREGLLWSLPLALLMLAALWFAWRRWR